MNTYILSYDPLAKNFTITQLFAYVKDNKNIFQYYTPFAGCYVLKSNEPLSVLQQSFSGLFEGSQFLIVKIEPFQSTGALPAEIWPWLNSGFNPFLPSS